MQASKLAQRVRNLKRQAAAPADWQSKWYNEFSSALVKYDQKESMKEIKRKLPDNVYRMSHLLKALEETKKELGNSSDLEDLKKAVNNNFYVNQIPPLKALMKKYGIL